MTVQDLINLIPVAYAMKPLPGYEWPPSIYYRYLAELVSRVNGRVFVELGTCGGGCSRHVALKNPNTTVVTIDIAKLPQVTLAEQQSPNFHFYLGDSVELAKTLGEKYSQQIDVMFIDTVHEYDHVMNEFNAWKQYLAKPAIVCFDDLNREGMDRAWRDLPGLKTGFHDLKTLHIAGAPNDGGFGALILG